MKTPSNTSSQQGPRSTGLSRRRIVLAALIGALSLSYGAAAQAQSIAPEGSWLSPREAANRPVGQTCRVRAGAIRLDGGNTGSVDGVLVLMDPPALSRERELAKMRTANPSARIFGRYTATVCQRPSGEKYLQFHVRASTSTD